jgi:3'-5' exoribonuclease
MPDLEGVKMIGRVKISNLNPGEIIIPDSRLFLLVRRSAVRSSKTGQRYIDLDLFDGETSVNGKIWDVDDDNEAAAQSGNIIHVLNGKVSLYQSLKQISINDIEALPFDKIDELCPDILPESFYKTEQLRQYWDDIVEQLEPKHRLLIDKFMADEKMWSLFTTIPGGRSMHHACRHGLWEHSISVAETAMAISQLFAEKYEVNVSLAVTAALLHDVGKLFEFQINRSTSMVERYTDRGRLLGHIYMGASWIEKFVAGCYPDDEDLKIDLIHILLSHHGEYEFGSPKLPSTIEALIVSTCDKLDADCDAIRSELVSGQPDGNWTKKVFMLDREFFKRRTDAGDGSPQPDDDNN